MTVSYDSLITDLPLGLELEHKTFTGWFTKPNCDGVQVADRYGEIPTKNFVNETVFDLSEFRGLSPMERRNHDRFKQYFNEIWKELDIGA